MPWLGWAAALLAALTAYVRVFGGALGLTQDFSGIMAKQRRMAALTVGLVAQAIAALFVRQPLAAARRPRHHCGRQRWSPASPARSRSRAQLERT